jgi:hypothetical protein
MKFSTIIAVIMAVMLVPMVVFAAGETAFVSNTISEATHTSGIFYLYGTQGESLSLTARGASSTSSSHTVAEVTFAMSDLTDGTNTISAPAINSVTNLAPGGFVESHFALAVPSDTPVGNYAGSLTSYGSADIETYNGGTLNFVLVVTQGTIVPDTNDTNDTGTTAMINGPDQIDIHVEPGDKVEYDFALQNTGDIDLTNVVVSFEGDLEDNDGDNIILSISPSTYSTITVGQTKVLEITTDVDNDFDISEVTGTVLIQTEQGYLEIPTTITVRPMVCEAGEIGDILNIDIDEPSSSDEFEIGDTINFEIDVENDGSSDRDFVLEAILYDVDEKNKVDSYKDEVEIDNDDNYVYEFSLKIDEDFDQDNDLKLFVKVYEDDDEESYCIEDSQSIDINQVDDKVLITDFDLTPNTASAGDMVEATITLNNVGDEEQDVDIEVKHASWGILGTYSSLYLDNSGSDSESTIRITFELPNDVEVGSEYITVAIDYAGERAHLDEILTISEASEKVDSLPVVLEAKAAQTSTATPTGAVSFENKAWEDYLIGGTVPTLVWVLVDIVLVLGIVALLVVVFRKK